MGCRLAVIVGNQYDKNEMIDLRLLHKDLIENVLNHSESENVGIVHSELREKVESFDLDRLTQLGYKFNTGIQMKENTSMENDGFVIRCGFSTLYWNLIQSLSCIKTYSSKA